MPSFGALLLYGVVGTANTLVCYALYVALLKLLHWDYNLALVADYGFGIVLGYALHRFSTFADRTHIRGAFGKYTVTLISSFFVNLALLDAMVRMQWLDAIGGKPWPRPSFLYSVTCCKNTGSFARTPRAQPPTIPNGPCRHRAKLPDRGSRRLIPRCGAVSNWLDSETPATA